MQAISTLSDGFVVRTPTNVRAFGNAGNCSSHGLGLRGGDRIATAASRITTSSARLCAGLLHSLSPAFPRVSRYFDFLLCVGYYIVNQERQSPATSVKPWSHSLEHRVYLQSFRSQFSLATRAKRCSIF